VCAINRDGTPREGLQGLEPLEKVEGLEGIEGIEGSGGFEAAMVGREGVEVDSSKQDSILDKRSN